MKPKCGVHNTFEAFSSRCRKLPKALKEWQAFNDLNKKINDFNESCPLLELMANKAMKERHWERIAKVTGHSFDLESDSFALRNIMEANLLPHKEDIEVKTLDTAFVYGVFCIFERKIWFLCEKLLLCRLVLTHMYTYFSRISVFLLSKRRTSKRS